MKAILALCGAIVVFMIVQDAQLDAKAVKVVSNGQPTPTPTVTATATPGLRHLIPM